MSTNKGDILAERIERIMDLMYCNVDKELQAALADYRNPWTLGRSVNGFTLGEGQEWHRSDWTEDMLPDGWRPVMFGEREAKGDEELRKGTWEKVGKPFIVLTNAIDWHTRTRRPLPTVIDPYAELKAALKAGKTIQVCDSRREIWVDEENPCFDAPVDRYRIKPAPKLVPLGPEDVTPGSALRKIGEKAWALVTYCTKYSVFYCDGVVASYSYEYMKEKCEISRDNGKTWQRCEKEEK